MTPATNAVAVKLALVKLVEGLQLGDVQVGYGPPPNPERDFIYPGAIRGPQEPATMRGGGILPRIEHLTLQLHIVVTRPGATSEEVLQAETRATELAGDIIRAVAADPKLNGLPGLLAIVSAGVELDSGADDDAASAWMTLRFEAKSHLR